MSSHEHNLVCSHSCCRILDRGRRGRRSTGHGNATFSRSQVNVFENDTRVFHSLFACYRLNSIKIRVLAVLDVSMTDFFAEDDVAVYVAAIFKDVERIFLYVYKPIRIIDYEKLDQDVDVGRSRLLFSHVNVARRREDILVFCA